MTPDNRHRTGRTLARKGELTLKLTNQLAAVISVSVLGVAAMVVCLAIWADWSDGAVVGMFAAFGSLATGLVVTLRASAKSAEQVDLLQRQVGAGQKSTAARLATVVEQTNGMSTAQIQDVASAAAQAAVDRYRAELGKAA